MWQSFRMLLVSTRGRDINLTAMRFEATPLPRPVMLLLSVCLGGAYGTAARVALWFSLLWVCYDEARLAWPKLRLVKNF